MCGKAILEGKVMSGFLKILAGAILILLTFSIHSIAKDETSAVDLIDYLSDQSEIPAIQAATNKELDSVAPEEFFIYREQDTGATVTLGRAALKGEYPSTVRLTLYFRPQNGRIRRSSCTGTIIHEDVVVTAAHCVVARGARLEAFDVNFGASLVSNQAYIRTMVSRRNVIVHRDYGRMDGADIALIRLSSSIPRDIAPPARLGSFSSFTEGYAYPIVAGWGRTVTSFSPFRMAAPDRLLFASVNYVTRPQEGDLEIRTERTVRVYGKELTVGACYGDSGGPQYAAQDPDATNDLVLMGVTSRGEHPWVRDPRREGLLCVAPGARSVFTSIPAARDSFIVPAIEALGVNSNELLD